MALGNVNVPEVTRKQFDDLNNKADSAVQNISVGGVEQTKTDGAVNLPAYPTSLPANGGNASTVNGHTVNKDVPSDAKFTDNNTTYTISEGDANGQIKVTPSSGSAYNASPKGLKSAAYTESSDYATAAQGTKADNAMTAINNSNSAFYVGKFKRTTGTVETVNFTSYTAMKDYANRNLRSSSNANASIVTDANIKGFGARRNYSTGADNIFELCDAVTFLSISDWGNVTSMEGTFRGCQSLAYLEISGLDVSSVRQMNSLFINCYSLTSLDLSGWNTSSLKYVGYMFYNCSSLTTLDLSGWSFSSVTSYDNMFSGCTALQTVYVSTPEAKTFIDARLQAAGLSVRATLKYDNAALTQLILSLPVYGAEWDGTSTTAWTRTDAAASFGACNPYVAGATFYSSPFDNIMPWAGMQIEERTGGTMVRIPKFYYKLTQTANNGMKIQITNLALPGFHCSPAHMDKGDGKGERDVVYVGRYHCCNSNYKSKTGEKPKVSITCSTARTSIHNLGTNIWQADFAMRFTLWLLYIVEFADWNSQVKIGKGCGDNSATGNMGYTDIMPYHTGTTQTSRDSFGLGTQYRYIEGLWDNCYDWTDGCYSNSSGMNIILNSNNFSDSSGGINIGTLVSRNCYPSKFEIKNVSGAYPMFIPTEANGSATTFSCDQWNSSTSNSCICVGGGYRQYEAHGMLFIGTYGASYADGSIGSRLMELP